MKRGCVVVGAGLSGLATAYRLASAGVDVLVLEARDRVGGRAWRIEVGGLLFDAGCEAVDSAHASLLGLAGELGISTWKTEAWAHGDGEPSRPLLVLEEEIDALAGRIDPARPLELEDAGRLDEQTLGGRLAELGASAVERAEAEIHYAVASSTVPIAQMSLLAYAAKLAAGAAPTGLTRRLDGGPTALAERLGAELDVRLGAEVVLLEQVADGVRIRLRAGDEAHAARAVVAVPLTVQRRLRFEPRLPEHRRLALARARYGDAVKAGFAYEEFPAVELPDVSAAGVLYRPDPRQPLLALFAGAAAACRARTELVFHEHKDRNPLSSAAAVRERHGFTPCAGGTQALGAAGALAQARAVRAVDWRQEPYIRGSYLVFGPGDLTAWGARLAEPHGRVHFAGSEASDLPSYMEGAVRAGERAAAEVLAAG